MSLYVVTDPATGDVVKKYPTATDAEIDTALSAATSASRTWARETTVAERAALIRRVGELHAERADEIGSIIVREMGKPRDAAIGEVKFSASIYEYYADHAEAILRDQPIELRGAPLRVNTSSMVTPAAPRSRSTSTALPSI
ncbi:aldehyde dehydrogenase family protein, partial [Mycolicibacterium porcinum]|uniref:aldehyde dehydrogenase family protein n=1 Tax=Mycolicibacterium porcinum TaxID=39693 RepID=UPI001041F209